MLITYIIDGCLELFCERHIPGGSNNQGDLFAPGTTRDQIRKAAENLVEKGTRITDPASRIQIFEKRMTVNGKRARYKVVVDSEDNIRVITIFPAESS